MKQGAVLLLIAVIVILGLYMGHLDEEQSEVVAATVDPVSEAFQKVQTEIDDILNSKSITESNKEFVMKQHRDFLDMLGKVCHDTDKNCFLIELNRQHRLLKGQHNVFAGK